MGLFDKLKGPVFIKESSDAQEQLEKLELLHGKAEGELKKLIEQDMKLLNYGIAGENSIIFELKNSFMPMLILHDLFLEHDGLTAQIDFLVITKKKIIVLECKNLFGNLEINSNGDFIRTIQMYGRNKKEGIYSPITQNQRHMDLLRKIRIESKNNLISKKLFDMAFEDRYKSVVVLANPKTVINGNIEDSDIYKELKAYRLDKSREESIKAFYIFNNSQMEDLIQKMPQNKEELLKVSGFNESKCVKYGEGILKIVNKYN